MTELFEEIAKVKQENILLAGQLKNVLAIQRAEKTLHQKEMEELKKQLDSIPAYVKESRFGSSPHNACCRETFQLLMDHLESQYEGTRMMSSRHDHVCKISINPSQWEKEFLREINKTNQPKDEKND